MHWYVPNNNLILNNFVFYKFHTKTISNLFFFQWHPHQLCDVDKAGMNIPIL